MYVALLHLARPHSSKYAGSTGTLPISSSIATRSNKLPHRLECNPGVLFFVLGFRERFYSNLTYLGFYLRWGCTELKIQIVI